MPEMHNNFYTDQAIGWPYLKYVAEELPRIIETYLRVSPKRENTYVAGLSMGGYGAMKIALTYPEKFGFAASFSGALDIVALMQDDKEQIAHEGQNLRGKKSDTEVVLETKEFIFGPHGTMKGSKTTCTSCWSRLPNRKSRCRGCISPADRRIRCFPLRWICGTAPRRWAIR